MVHAAQIKTLQEEMRNELRGMIIMRKNIQRIGPSTSQSHTPREAMSARSSSSQASNHSRSPNYQAPDNKTKPYQQKDNLLALP